MNIPQITLGIKKKDPLKWVPKPERDWNTILFLAGILLFLLLGYAMYVFQGISTEKLFSGGEVLGRAETIDRKGLGVVLDTFSQKEELHDGILQNRSQSVDPSL